MNKLLIILSLIVGCALLDPSPEVAPGEFEIGMPYEEFKQKNPLSENKYKQSVALYRNRKEKKPIWFNGDTLIYTRIEDWSKRFEKSYWQFVEYFFVDGKLYEVKVNRKPLKWYYKDGKKRRTYRE